MTENTNSPIPSVPDEVPGISAHDSSVPPRSQERPHGPTALSWAFATAGLAIGIVIGTGATLLVGGALTGAGGFAQGRADAAAAKAPEGAVIACGVGTSEDVTIGSDKLSVSVSGAGRLLGDPPSFEETACIGTQVGMPDSVISRMGNTRALDGTQEASWDGYLATWSYHPDDGMSVVYSYEGE